MSDIVFQIKSEETKDDYGKFSIEPLEQGYGHTLGSSLRRVLLSSIPGAAVTQVRVSGLKHQFGTIKGVREDGVDLLLNIKSLRVSYSGSKPVKLTLSAKGKGEVKASKINAPAGVKIANPDLVIATLANAQSKLDIDMQVETGLGYSPAEDRKTNTIGLIPLDADFSPIKRVNYKVEETRVGRLTNYDKLTMEIWTDGSVSSWDSLRKSAETLIGYLGQIVSPAKLEKKVQVKDALPVKLSTLSVEELNLPTRIANALVKAGYETVNDIVGADIESIVKVRNLGEKSIKIIRTALKAKGVSWKE
ncbi:MAG: DNA-directed RNA polymerase subunit alpha [Candidatus Blackburnbacteria bacterium]|nr:DNA-directed RNA polymerase subunit alpha [Candidatus Blackburnbacteria bacterium]